MGLWFIGETRESTLEKEKRSKKGICLGKHLNMRRNRISSNIFEVQHANEAVALRKCELRAAIIFQMT